MSNMKTFKKGEIIFKEGDKIQYVFVIQAGSVSCCLIKAKKNIELFQLGNSQILGDSVYLGATTHPYSAVATVETKVVEIPVDFYKQQIESAPQMVKVIVKSLTERNKYLLGELKSAKNERDASPCPDDQLAKAFSAIYYTVLNKSEKQKDRARIDYNQMRQYAQRVFGEPLKRLEQIVAILVKLKCAQYVMGKLPDDPDGPDQVVAVDFFDITGLENTFEFWQYHYFKGGKTELLKIDDSVMQTLMILVKMTEKLPVDRHGSVAIEYSKVVEIFKDEFGINLIPDHFTRLESKGLYVKRAANTQNVVFLSFDLKEFQATLKVWRNLREIEKLNEKGMVDMQEPELGFPKKKVATGITCPQCSADVKMDQKFCAECGAKLAISA